MLNTMVIFIFPLRLSFNKKGLILVLAKSRDTRGKYKALITGLVIEAERSKASIRSPRGSALNCSTDAYVMYDKPQEPQIPQSRTA